MITAREVPVVLAQSRDLVEPALRAAVGTLGGELERVAAYHLGWTDAEGRPTSGGGKGVRPALALLSAEAVGADPAVAVPGATAVELIHNFSLLHDDIIDGDTERRHRPTVWALYGVGSAVIAGDALFALALRLLLDQGQAGLAAAADLTRATAMMIEGQADDMAFESRLDVTVDECLTMESRKTGALLSCASSIGAVLGGGPDDAIAALRDYGHQLGVAFQAVDDLLGIWGDPARTGKSRWSDMDGGKKSLPITAALAADNPAAFELRELLAGAPLDDDERARAAELVEAAGGRACAEDVARRSLAGAIDALSRAELVPSAAAELRDLAVFVVEREF